METIQLIIDYFIEYIESLSPFIQALLGAFVFALTSWIARFCFENCKNKVFSSLALYKRSDMAKHIIHKEFVRSKDVRIALDGLTVVLFQAARYIVYGLLIIIFFFGVHSIINGQWLFIAASWFSFNAFLEAHNWLKDTSDEKHISHISEEMKKEIYNILKLSKEEANND